MPGTDDQDNMMYQPERAEFSVEKPRIQARPLWRSLEELADDDSFKELLEHEFPHQSVQWMDASSRRHFLRLMGASLALSGIAGCAIQPYESIVPYVEQPESLVPGKPMFYATALASPSDSCATGVLVESHMGRPIKIEGNPDHPASQGATDAFTQAEILTFYDPDRSQVVLHNGRVDTWEHFQSLLLDVRIQMQAVKGRGLRVLTPSVLSPTLADQLKRLHEQFPESRWHSHEPVLRDGLRESTRRAFGELLEPVYHLEKVDVILALDADFLASGPGHLRNAREFASRRGESQAGTDGSAGMNRLYVAECTPSLTGAMADHRIAVSARDVALVAQQIAQALKIEGIPSVQPGRISAHDDWISALVSDLREHRGRSLVVAGERQSPDVHVLAHLINHALGNLNETVKFYPLCDQGPANQLESLSELTRDLHRGAVKCLLILGANPVYDAPADLDFAGAMADAKIPLRIHLGLHDDETAEVCHWHVPAAHCLESWGDLRTFDGSVTIQQPLIAPLYQGKSAHELISVLLGEPLRSGLDILRDYWKRQSLPGNFDTVWRQALQSGLLPGTAVQARSATLKTGDDVKHFSAAGSQQPEGLELVFQPDPTIWDGRFANNGWLQELPKPLTRLTWDNVALISPSLAGRRGISNEDVIELTYQGRTVRLPAWIMPGQAEDTITVTLGHGRWRAGRIGTSVGANVNVVRTSDAPWFGSGLEIARTGERHPLATIQHHNAMAGRDLVRVGTIDQFRQHPDFAQEPDKPHEASLGLYPEKPRGEHAENAWGMAIDLDRCIGCGACVAACQAENNIPIVGKEQVLHSRKCTGCASTGTTKVKTPTIPELIFNPCLACTVRRPHVSSSARSERPRTATRA